MSKRTVQRPEHCGGCDPRTRQVEDPETGAPRRCPNCHPGVIPLQSRRYATPTVPGPTPAESGWMREARRAIEHLASQGVPFAAEDVAELGIGEPDHPNHWGVAFQAAHREGLIAPVSIGPSPREARRGGVRRMWTGDPDRVALAPQGGGGGR